MDTFDYIKINIFLSKEAKRKILKLRNIRLKCIKLTEIQYLKCRKFSIITSVEPRQHIKKQRHYFADKSLVKAMIFPVATYGCESWTIKKLSAKELMLSNCGVGEDS